MKESYIDLHVHSDCSDGTLSPREVVQLAHEKKLSAIALTDHDTIDGVRAAREEASKFGIELIPGIEFSTAYLDRDVHMLGLGIDIDNSQFTDQLHQFLDSRDVRNEKMIHLLQEHDIDITWNAMLERFPDSVWTRAHFARFLLEHGYIGSIQEAFSRYIGDHCPCYVPREKVTPEQAIRLIHQGGGKAVLAHPLLYRLKDKELETLVQFLAKRGLDGIEAIYSKNRGMDENKVRLLAKKYNLKISGGSDFHGANKPDIDLGSGRGNLKIPYEIWKNLKGL